MSFSSNDTLKKLEKILPKSINNQTVPKDLLIIIDEYIPKLDNKNIHQVVKDYLSKNENKKQQIINTYGSISNWNVSHVTNMKELFKDQSDFNEDISNWNTSNVTTMNHMFCDATSFNEPLNNWNVSNVTDM